MADQHGRLSDVQRAEKLLCLHTWLDFEDAGLPGRAAPLLPWPRFATWFERIFCRCCCFGCCADSTLLKHHFDRRKLFKLKIVLRASLNSDIGYHRGRRGPSCNLPCRHCSLSQRRVSLAFTCMQILTGGSLHKIPAGDWCWPGHAGASKYQAVPHSHDWQLHRPARTCARMRSPRLVVAVLLRCHLHCSKVQRAGRNFPVLI